MPADHFLPFAKPSIDEAAINEVVDSLRSGWLATGPKVQKFECALKEYLNAPHVSTLNSATGGLHVALLGLNLQPGDEVITTPLTFIATLNTIVQAGATPVLVDIDPHTYNLDTNQVATAITARTRAIVPVHYAGLPVDLDALYTLAKRHDLRIIEDAAHAIGAEYKGKKIGSFGDTQVFSFHPNKNMTTGEGGCVATRDADLLKTINVLKFHGIDRDAWARFGKKGSQHYQVIAPGFKYNMMDLQAAIGLHQLPRLDDFIARRTAIAERYLTALSGRPQFTLPRQPDYAHTHAWHLFAPCINPDAAGMDRDTFMAKMKEKNIGTGLHYEACHLHPYYRDTFGFKKGQFPHAEQVGAHIVSLPLFPDLSIEQQEAVLHAISEIFGETQ